MAKTEEVEVQPDSPETRLARDLAYGQEGSQPLRQVGTDARDAALPEDTETVEDLRLDEGALEEYDQEELARDLDEDGRLRG